MMLLLLLPLPGIEVCGVLQLLHCFSDFNFLQELERFGKIERENYNFCFKPGAEYKIICKWINKLANCMWANEIMMLL